MDKNFRVRVACGFVMIIVAAISIYAFDAIPFKILFALVAVVAAVELFSFFWKTKKHKIENIILAILQLVFLIYGCLFFAGISGLEIWYVIFGVCGYDIFAYLFGRLLGGKIIKKSHPFPKISPNKTWEGTVFGLLISVGLVFAALMLTGSTAYAYLLCGPLALAGDLFESYLKRQFKVKDSNEIVIKKPFFAKLELIVGGSEGHGGFLDRIDSLSFTATILLLIFAGF